MSDEQPPPSAPFNLEQVGQVLSNLGNDALDMLFNTGSGGDGQAPGGGEQPGQVPADAYAKEGHESSPNPTGVAQALADAEEPGHGLSDPIGAVHELGDAEEPGHGPADPIGAPHGLGDVDEPGHGPAADLPGAVHEMAMIKREAPTPPPAEFGANEPPAESGVNAPLTPPSQLGRKYGKVSVAHDWSAEEWEWPLQHHDGVVKVHLSPYHFDVGFDCAHYTPDEIEVGVVEGGVLEVHCRHVARSDRHGEIAREVLRSYKLPAHTDDASIKSHLDKRGVLHVSGVRNVPPEEGCQAGGVEECCPE